MFVDESGFLLIPNVRRTWAPRGETPSLRHRYRHDRLSVCSGVAVSPRRRQVALYLYCRARNLTGLDIETFLRHLLRHLRGPVDLLWDRGPNTSSRAIPGCTSTSSLPTRPNSTPPNMSGLRRTGHWPMAPRMIWPSFATPSGRRSVASGARRISCGPASTPQSCRGPDDPFHCLCKAQ